MVASVSNTVVGIIKDAMTDAGLLQEGADPNSEQLHAYQRRLCDIINLWQTQGLKLFLLQDISIPLVSGQNLYTVGTGGSVDMTKPMRGLQAYVLSSSNDKRPLIPMSWNEWMNLSQTTGSTGAINSYFIDKQALLLKLYVWNTPNAVEALNSLHLLFQIQAANPINLEEDLIFPQEWRIALRWGLADDICTGQPQAIMDRCESRANTYREMLEDWDVEDTSTRWTPDMRNALGGAFE